MKILFVIAHFGGSGGQSVQSKRLIDELAKSNEVKVLTLSKGNYLELPENCEVVGDLKLSSIFKLSKRIKEIYNEYDIIQVLDSYYSLLAVYLANVNKPVVLRLGADPLNELKDKERYFYYSVYYFLEKLMFRKVNHFVVNNTHFSKRIIDRKNLEWIPNGFFPVDYSRIKGENFTLLFVGYLSKMKNVEFIVKAMSKLNDCKLYIVGDIEGEYREEYLRLVKSYDVSNVIFVGKIPAKDVKNYYERSDVFVFPSLREGFPNSVLEAMFYGLPVVCKNIDAMQTIIRNGENGFLFDSEEEYLEIINKLRDNTFRNKVSKAALNEVCEKYTIDQIAKKYLNLYKRLI